MITQIDKDNAEKYAYLCIPNANSQDAPFVTTGDRFDEVKEAYLEACNEKNKELLDKEKEIINFAEWVIKRDDWNMQIQNFSPNGRLGKTTEELYKIFINGK